MRRLIARFDRRIERCRMLENTAFVEGLLEAFCRNEDQEYRLIAMDILIWITSIRMCRYRSSFGEDSTLKRSLDDVASQQLEYARVIEEKFFEIIKFGYIEGNRKLAHKVTKLLISCSVYVFRRFLNGNFFKNGNERNCVFWQRMQKRARLGCGSVRRAIVEDISRLDTENVTVLVGRRV